MPEQHENVPMRLREERESAVPHVRPPLPPRAVVPSVTTAGRDDLRCGTAALEAAATALLLDASHGEAIPPVSSGLNVRDKSGTSVWSTDELRESEFVLGVLLMLATCVLELPQVVFAQFCAESLASQPVPGGHRRGAEVSVLRLDQPSTAESHPRDASPTALTRRRIVRAYTAETPNENGASACMSECGVLAAPGGREEPGAALSRGVNPRSLSQESSR